MCRHKDLNLEVTTMEKQYDQIVETILNILSEKIMFGVKYDERINADTALLSSGVGLDSVAVLQLIAAIEDQFGVFFDDTDLSIELFKNVGSLSKAVQQKIRTYPSVDGR